MMLHISFSMVMKQLQSYSGLYRPIHHSCRIHSRKLKKPNRLGRAIKFLTFHTNVKDNTNNSIITMTSKSPSCLGKLKISWILIVTSTKGLIYTPRGRRSLHQVYEELRVITMVMLQKKILYNLEELNQQKL